MHQFYVVLCVFSVLCLHIAWCKTQRTTDGTGFDPLKQNRSVYMQFYQQTFSLVYLALVFIANQTTWEERLDGSAIFHCPLYSLSEDKFYPLLLCVHVRSWVLPHAMLKVMSQRLNKSQIIPCCLLGEFLYFIFRKVLHEFLYKPSAVFLSCDWWHHRHCVFFFCCSLLFLFVSSWICCFSWPRLQNQKSTTCIINLAFIQTFLLTQTQHLWFFFESHKTKTNLEATPRWAAGGIHSNLMIIQEGFLFKFKSVKREQTSLKNTSKFAWLGKKFEEHTYNLS